MACIYKIENKINGKVYIGQTITPLNQRMSKHFSRARTGENLTGIDAAIAKYGQENFNIEIIDTCEANQLDELERFYIAKYDSYNNGYNLTKGGQDGLGSKLEIDIEQAYQIYLEEQSMKRAAERIGCSDKTLSNYFQDNGKDTTIFQMKNAQNNLLIGAEKKKKKIRIVEKNLVFDSIRDCGRWLIDQGLAKTDINHAAMGISRVLNGQRQSYLKMHYEEVKD